MITIVATPRFGLKQPLRRTPLDQVRRRALDLRAQAGSRARHLTAQAQTRAGGELDRGRIAAATKLEALAQALRPHHPSVRGLHRGKLHVGPRSTLAIAATIGIGVALGLAVSNQLKKRRAARGPQPLLREELPPLHEAQAHEPVGAVP